jgi:hypothetical protein
MCMRWGDDPAIRGGLESAWNLIVYANALAAKFRGSEVKNTSNPLRNGIINGEPVPDETFGWILRRLENAWALPCSAVDTGRSANGFPGAMKVVYLTRRH